MLFLFEEFSLDTDRRELRRGADAIAVEPQVFDLLTYLIEHRDRVVSKDDLITSIWGGRAISESTLTTRLNAARSAIGDSGSEQRLIKTLFRKGVRFVGAVREERPRSAAFPSVEAPSIALSLPDRPSIAVLPFTNMSGDAEQEYFADGVAEEIITALSRFSGLFVIARNSSFTYKGRAVDVKQVGRELAVRYVLEGSVRKAARQVRIAGQLIDAADGAHLWADRFDGAPEDIFSLEDRVTAGVVAAIVPKVEQEEIKRARRKPTEKLNAYDYFLRGMASFYQYDREANVEALRLFRRAIEIDPDFAGAYAMASRCYQQRHVSRWTDNKAQETFEGTKLARRAIELGRDDAVALCNAGWVLHYLARDTAAAAVFIDRARALNPNLAAAWLASGYVRLYLGDSEAAITHFTQAMRLSPLDPLIYTTLAGVAWAHFRADRYEEAASWAERALRENPNWHSALICGAASSALIGQLSSAEKLVARLRELDPALRISMVNDFLRFRRPEDSVTCAEGLKRAGFPE